MSFYSNEEGAGFRFGSNGLGPAELKRFYVTVDNVRIRSWEDVFRALDFDPKVEFDYKISSPAAGSWYQANSPSTWIVRVLPGPKVDELVSKNSRIGIGVEPFPGTGPGFRAAARYPPQDHLR